MSECSNAPRLKYSNTLVFEHSRHSNTRSLECSNTQTLEYSNTQILEYSKHSKRKSGTNEPPDQHARTLKDLNTRTLEHSNTQSIQILEHANARPCRHGKTGHPHVRYLVDTILTAVVFESVPSPVRRRDIMRALSRRDEQAAGLISTSSRRSLQ